MRSVQGQVYEKGRKLGSGAYGVVYTVVRKEDNKIFAYKNYTSSPKDLDVGALREISLLQMLKKSNYCEEYGIISLVDIIFEKNEIGIILPLYKINLEMAITKNMLSGENKLNIYHKLLKSLCFLHENNIIHRDIKPDNIMLDNKYNPILIDFTLAKMFTASGETHTGGISTIGYRAPEVEGKNPYGFPSDSWSLGVLLSEMYGKTLPIFSKFLDKDPVTRLTPQDALYENFMQKCNININNLSESIIDNTIDETISMICENLEIKKSITSNAAQIYYRNTNCDPYMAVLLAYKFYETIPIDIEYLDMDGSYFLAERNIMTKMRYNLNVIENVR